MVVEDCFGFGKLFLLVGKDGGVWLCRWFASTERMHHAGERLKKLCGIEAEVCG
jgi:hypothetical protein